MQLFIADAYFEKKNAPENMKKTQKLLIIGQKKIQYCQPAQNQPKSHILYLKNGSLCNFYIMTLPIAADNRPAAMQFFIFIFDNNHPRMLKVGIFNCKWVLMSVGSWSF